ncbi:MAG: flagellar basal body P-ring protein FlgI [Pirellulaceae bacterium]
MMPKLRTIVGVTGLLWMAGCTSLWMQSQDPDADDLGSLTQEEEESQEFIGDLTVPTGLNFVKIEGVGLVNGLDRTGSSPAPSSLLNRLLNEMRSHSVPNPEKLLESDENSLVVVRGYLPPGVQKGDRFDVQVVTPPESETSDLRGGHLFRTRLREMRVLQGRVRSGHVAGLAGGMVVTDTLFNGTDDAVEATRGRVLGGGQSRISRSLGLVVRGESTVRRSAMIGSAINDRFHITDPSGKHGVATPKRDNYIELAVHRRYKNNLSRYVRVIGSIALRESAGERMMRIESLQRRLLEPTTAPRAALRLEAIGDDAAHVLVEGLKSPELEVRFHAAEALAYLDREEAASVLAETAIAESAFRWHALTALTVMDHVAAYESLNDLLHVKSSETRYGAFRALRTRNAADPVVRGESLDGKFAYHVISSNGPAMIHISKAQRPEIVVFGAEQPIVPPAFLSAGKKIMVKGLDDGQLKVTRFTTGTDADHRETCDATIDQMIRTIVKLGGRYSDVIEALQGARKGGYLESKLVVNALARPDRTYHRDESDGDEPTVRPHGPIPELFSDRLEHSEEDQEYLPDEIKTDETEKGQPDSSFMGGMTGWFQR